MFLRYHEMNDLFVSKFPVRGEDLYLDRIGDVTRHPSHHGMPSPRYFGDELGEDSYYRNKRISLKFLGLGRGVEGDAQGVVGLSCDGMEVCFQFAIRQFRK